MTGTDNDRFNMIYNNDVLNNIKKKILRHFYFTKNIPDQEDTKQTTDEEVRINKKKRKKTEGMFDYPKGSFLVFFNISNSMVVFLVSLH